MAHIIDTLPNDVDLRLITSDRDLGDKHSYPGLSGRWVDRGNSKIYYLNASSRRQWFAVWKRLRADSPDLLYVNSLFNPRFSLVPILASWLRMIRPSAILIAPRGELSPGALQLKSVKKRAFIAMWRYLLRGSKVFWHASAELEAADIRRQFIGASVVVNQNQSGLPREPLRPVATSTVAKLVFISRVSPKKNLAAALEALQRVEREVEYDIYGPIEDKEYWRTCQRVIDRLPPNVRVRYCGELEPSEVRATFATYDAFVFPTRGENFGHVIAESLSASCPVVCTDQTPWTDRLAAGGGIVIGNPIVESLSEILSSIAGSDSEQRLAARKRCGEIFREWRQKSDQLSIFDAVRQRSMVRREAR
ncbi:glycosyltransferase [Mangrovihabitans endophyticus]|uniref:glycosyltransferase n=1 Tax=Mangrovihabitans endophyticus TaxID=1751298 RepID=UPI00166CC378|nr:glycosyltransferase [Mangrovihabitans endophyticus]